MLIWTNRRLLRLRRLRRPRPLPLPPKSRPLWKIESSPEKVAVLKKENVKVMHAFCVNYFFFVCGMFYGWISMMNSIFYVVEVEGTTNTHTHTTTTTHNTQTPSHDNIPGTHHDIKHNKPITTLHGCTKGTQCHIHSCTCILYYVLRTTCVHMYIRYRTCMYVYTCTCM